MKKDLGLFVKVSESVTDVESDLHIGADLTRAMSDQPGLFAYYAGQSEVAYHRAKRIKYQLHCKREELDAKYRREEIEDKSKKRVTDKAIEARINRHPEMRALYEQYLKTRRVAGLLMVLSKAFEQRADMLRSIGANRRREFDQGEIRTLKQKAGRVTRNIRREAESEDE